MNKKLSVLAVGAVLAMGAMAAQADPKVYGKANVSLDSTSGLANDAGLWASSNNSRWGIKGDVDAGEGVKAIYQMEQGVYLDQGGAAISSYNSFAGVSFGPAATVMIGYHDNPLKLIGRKVDLFGDTIGDSRAITGYGTPSTPAVPATATTAAVKAGPAFTESRLSSGIGYMGKFGDIGVTVGFVPQDGRPKGFNGYVASVEYGTKTLYVGAGIHGVTLADGADSESAMRLGASYTINNMIKINALYSSVSGYAMNKDNSRSAMGLGAAFAINDMQAVKFQYYTVGENGISGAAKDSGTLMALGYDYKMSKDVTAYAVYAAASNDDAGTVAIGSASGVKSDGGAAVAGDSNSGLSLGVVFGF